MPNATEEVVGTEISFVVAEEPTPEELMGLESEEDLSYCTECKEHFNGPQEYSRETAERLCAMCNLKEEGYEY